MRKMIDWDVGEDRPYWRSYPYRKYPPQRRYYRWGGWRPYYYGIDPLCDASSENAEQFTFLRAYSPYQHVTPGTKYPAVLLTAGEHDSRVHALHARKMAALLQASTAADPRKEPVLLWVDRDAGHGQGKPLNLRIRDVADWRIFVMWQLGMLQPSGS